VDYSFDIRALDGFRISGFDALLSTAAVSDESRNLVPTLVRSYIRAGAVIVGDPAVDFDFNCGDLFVVLDISKMSSLYNRKYQVN